ncbi:PepSY-associated TM helix domain-containing protein [Novipirellula caenicola]|uniref:PepSY domain-containing protein n=1 Tax=Novipirellula caenicola TaxID=1536901 RepID=A0ABP9VU76_9BACT
MNTFDTAKLADRNRAVRFRLRKLWLLAHRWLGLTIGLVFVLIGLTGSLLVFDHAIDERLNSDLLLTNRSGQPRTVAEIIVAAEAFYDDGAKQALSVSRPRVDDGVWTVWFAGGTDQAPKYIAVHVDPYSASVTGQRVWGEDLMSWIYRLHFQLVAGRIGSIIVGIIGVLVLLSIGSGILLWWPLWKHSWRAAFAIRRGRRFNYDVHKTFGIVSAGFLAVITFTGVYMEFPAVFRSVAGVFSEVSKEPRDLTSDPQESRKPLTPDEAIAIARSTFPNAKFDHLHPPANENGTYEVAFRQPDEVQTSYGRSQVFLDQYSGRVLSVRSPADFSAADAFFAWQFPLHNGEAFGLMGRWAVLFFGLTPALLYISGAIVWWRKRRPQHSKNRRSAGQPTEIDSVADVVTDTERSRLPAAKELVSGTTR